MKINNLYIFIIFFTLIYSESFSQGQGRGQGRYGRGQREKLESARIAFITEKMALTPEQAEKFWPLYNDYNRKRAAIREEMVKNRLQTNINLDEKQALQVIRQHHANSQKEVDLEKEYIDQILKILSARQVVVLLSAEIEFRRVLLERLSESNK